MTELHKKIIAMLLAGSRDRDLIRDEIATPRVLVYVKRMARMQGVVFPRYKIVREKPAGIGNLSVVLKKLSHGERDWLLRNVPHKLTVAEFCIALIRDAAAE